MAAEASLNQFKFKLNHMKASSSYNFIFVNTTDIADIDLMRGEYFCCQKEICGPLAPRISECEGVVRYWLGWVRSHVSLAEFVVSEG